MGFLDDGNVTTDRDARVVMTSGKDKGSMTAINHRTIIVIEGILKSILHKTKC